MFYDPALLCNGNSRFQSACDSRLRGRRGPHRAGLRGVTTACEQIGQLRAGNGVAIPTQRGPGGLPPPVGGNSEVKKALAKQNPESPSLLSSGFSCCALAAWDDRVIYLAPEAQLPPLAVMMVMLSAHRILGPCGELTHFQQQFPYSCFYAAGFERRSPRNLTVQPQKGRDWKLRFGTF